MSTSKMDVLTRAFQGAKAIAEGLATTFKHVTRSQVTIGYPEVRSELPAAFRGMPGLPPDKSGNTTCIGCLACARVCPPQCIFITTSKGEDRKLRIDDFIVDANLCIMCGLCEEVCPVTSKEDKTDYPGRAIQLTHLYEMSAYCHEDLVFHLPQLIAIGQEFGRQKSKDLPGQPRTACYSRLAVHVKELTRG
ncbi:MAG: NADH-quinone oxidoreductase subunit I [Cyanobacteria bacterium NC_groundwater_1444_Ag_S-0.65um_54_12]|nr:NADH-quinone oxidoreductase subunit I [Cyanobacteria bacterium NC_groundwater_1444_Ag_S-0.65um_54_12]